jgi:hypothetical protein
MAVGLFNIILGVACIAGGLSGKLTLLGTQSGTALVVAGGVAVGLGLVQVARNRRRG